MSLNNYLSYLQFINGHITRFFNSQKPYIKCQRGCAKCCQNGEYPFSEIEFQLLQLGFRLLEKEKQDKILQNIAKIKANKEKASSKNTFVYECPFLIDNECSVYKYRGLICRTFGLMYMRENNTPQIPFCAFEGLNYSNVLDPENKKISAEKWQKLGEKIEPLAFNVSYKEITKKEYEEKFNFKFGEFKSLIDWL